MGKSFYSLLSCPWDNLPKSVKSTVQMRNWTPAFVYCQDISVCDFSWMLLLLITVKRVFSDNWTFWEWHPGHLQSWSFLWGSWTLDGATCPNGSPGLDSPKEPLPVTAGKAGRASLSLSGRLFLPITCSLEGFETIISRRNDFHASFLSKPGAKAGFN